MSGPAGEMLRALLVWLLLCVLAVINGAVREAALVPSLGVAAAHVASTALLCAIILVVAWLTTRWVGARTARDAWRVGLLWVTLTLAFELLAGHYAFGASWSALLADYDVTRGRVWILVPIVTLLAPVAAARGRRRA